MVEGCKYYSGDTCFSC
jgi:hypothetical protein